MSRATVRAGVASWLTGRVPGINTVYRSFPRVIPAPSFVAGQTGARYGAVASVHILSDAEARIALGGANAGWKRLDYQIEIQLFFRWTGPAVTGDGGLEASDAFDTIVDALKARIRADRTAGGTVWQWGEKRLTGRYGELVERGDALELWAGIVTEVTEMLPT